MYPYSLRRFFFSSEALVGGVATGALYGSVPGPCGNRLYAENPNRFLNKTLLTRPEEITSSGGSFSQLVVKLFWSISVFL